MNLKPTLKWNTGLSIVQGSLGFELNISDGFSAYLNTAAGKIKPCPGTLNDDLNVPHAESRFKADMGIVKSIHCSGKITAALFTVLQDNTIVLSGSTYLDTETNIRRELYLNRDQNQWGLEVDLVPNTLFNIVKPLLNFTIMQSLLTAGPQPLGNFLTTDINARYTIKGKSTIRFYVRVKNLGNVRYSTVNGYPDFGRMLSGGITISFIKVK